MGQINGVLAAVSNLNLQFTVFAMTFQMIISSAGWKGWYFTPLLLLLYQVLVRTGGNVQNPLQLYTGQNEEDANHIINIAYPFFLLGFCWVGWAWMNALGCAELFPLRKRLPRPGRRRAQDEMVRDRRSGENVVRRLTERQARRKRPRWGAPGLLPSWFHLAITALYLLGFVCAPQVVYDQYIGLTGRSTMAWLVVLLVPLGGGGLYLALCCLWPDDYVFGLTGRYFDAHPVEGVDEAAKERATRDARMSALASILPIVLFNVVGNLALGGTRLLSPAIQANWVMSTAMVAVLLVLLVAMLFAGWLMRQLAARKKAPEAPLDDSGEYYEDVASVLPTPAPLSRRAPTSALGGNFAAHFVTTPKK